jgi:hypothetical protein
MMKQVECSAVCLVLALALASLDDPEYYGPALPKEPGDISVKPFEGERYRAEVPDTLDLAYHADEALNALTHMISPAETDYLIYHLAWGQFNPTIFEIGHGSKQSQNAKWAESVVLMRAISQPSPPASMAAKGSGKRPRAASARLSLPSPSRSNAASRRRLAAAGSMCRLLAEWA